MKNLFKFIEDRYPEYPTPLKAKLIYDPESITEKDLIIKGNLDLENSKITQLPDNLQVGGYLYLGNTPITQLPNNLQVRGNLRSANTLISQLPDNLQVGGSLDLYYTKIAQLPNNLKVGGNLWLSNTPLSEKYSKEQIRQIIEDKGGYVGGQILT